jgi:hypothetical protein
MKLDRASDTESIGIGSYITLPCRTSLYICKVSDVGYAQLDLHETIVSTKLQELREKNVVIEPFRRKVTESPFFYSVTLKPLKMIKDTEILEPQYLPRIFTTGRFTTLEDIEPTFERFQVPVEVGTFKGMKGNVPCKFDLHELQYSHTGIFAKTKSGKTYLAKVICSHIVRAPKRAVLIFDMHQEYGFSPKGLRQIFEEDELLVFSVDSQSKADEIIRIPYSTISVDDLILCLGDELSSAMVDALYEAESIFGPQWFAAFARTSSDPEERNAIVDDLVIRLGGNRDEKENVREGPVKRGTIQVLRRKIGILARYEFVVPEEDVDSIKKMIENLKKGCSVILDFGRYSRNPRVYVLVSNLLTKSLFESCSSVPEEDREKIPMISVLVEEAHRFLGTEARKRNTVFPILAREGRKYRLGIIVIDQKPSQIDEEVISQLHTQIFLRLTSDEDIQKIRKASEEDITDYIPEIKRLNVGEALAVGEAVTFPSSFKVMHFDVSEFKRKFPKGKKKAIYLEA